MRHISLRRRARSVAHPRGIPSNLNLSNMTTTTVTMFCIHRKRALRVSRPRGCRRHAAKNASSPRSEATAVDSTSRAESGRSCTTYRIGVLLMAEIVSQDPRSRKAIFQQVKQAGVVALLLAKPAVCLNCPGRPRWMWSLSKDRTRTLSISASPSKAECLDVYLVESWAWDDSLNSYATALNGPAALGSVMKQGILSSSRPISNRKSPVLPGHPLKNSRMVSERNASRNLSRASD